MENTIDKIDKFKKRLDKAVIGHATSTAAKTKKAAKKVNTAVIDHAMSTGKKARKATKEQFKKRGESKQHKTDF